jgi:hypothetical protein
MMKSGCAGTQRERVTPKRLSVGALVATVFAALAFTATSGAAALEELEIVPGKSIGYAALGMSRKSVQHKLKSPVAPQRSQSGRFYSLTYKYPYRPNSPQESQALSIVFNGLGKSAKAFYMVGVDPRLYTNPGGLSPESNTLHQLTNRFGGVACYHVESDGSRDSQIESTENFECELHKNGAYTYFSFASRDADPQQYMGPIAISAIRIH